MVLVLRGRAELSPSGTTNRPYLSTFWTPHHLTTSRTMKTVREKKGGPMGRLGFFEATRRLHVSVMLHHVMPVWWSLTPFPAGNNAGFNEASVVENRGIERLMRPSNYAAHFDEVIWGRAFDALHMGRMNKGGVVEAAGRFGAKVCPRIRVKATKPTAATSAEPAVMVISLL